MEDFEFLDHTADLHMRVRGKSAKELFQNALTGLFQVIVPVNTSESVSRPIQVDAKDREGLLVAFLNELLANLDIYKESYERLEIETLTPTRLAGILSGFKIKKFGTQVKGATYHDLSIRDKQGYLEADIIFDI